MKRFHSFILLAAALPLSAFAWSASFATSTSNTASLGTWSAIFAVVIALITFFMLAHLKKIKMRKRGTHD